MHVAEFAKYEENVLLFVKIGRKGGQYCMLQQTSGVLSES